LIPAAHTPFHHDGALNLEVVAGQARFFLECGVKGVFIGGTTGECASLAVDERKALCDRWVDIAGDTLQIAVHVGDNCLANAVELAAHARQAGATAVAAMSPSYFKPSTIADLVDFCIPIAAEVDPLPFYFYHIPGTTGVRLPMSDFLHHAQFKIPNLRGLKYSHDDLTQLQLSTAFADGAFDVLYGCDESLLAGLCLGVRGAVGSTYNFAAPHYHRIIRAFESGDLAKARTLQLQSAEMIQTLNSFGFMAASKAVMSLVGVDCGPVRAPIRNLTPGQLDALANQLASTEILARSVKLLA
jgi:N-acetylneuraminate lyase